MPLADGGTNCLMVDDEVVQLNVQCDFSLFN